MTNNAVAHIETSHTFTNLNDLARNICTGDERVFDPREDHTAHILFHPVDGVGCHGSIPDDNLVFPWRSVRSRLDLERFYFWCAQPCCCVGRHCELSDGHRTNMKI